MPQQPSASIENNFTGGLKTEFTGLNFPENSATAADNVIFDIVGNVKRREGFKYELNSGGGVSLGSATGKAIQTYLWKNAGGDGSTQLLVEQFGSTLYFYRATAATTASPLSTQKLVSTVDVSTFLVVGSSLTIADIGCQFSDGNGYLFVYHPSCEPFYCTFNLSDLTVVGRAITLNVRDFDGLPETGLSDTARPPTLSDTHKYNLINQGWTSSPSWSISTGLPSTVGSTWTYSSVPSGLTITPGTRVNVYQLGVQSGWNSSYVRGIGVVTSYSSTTLVITVSSTYNPPSGWQAYYGQYIEPISVGFINEWFTDTGFYPSNSDVWWNFKNSSDVFDPATTLGNVTLSSPAPKGQTIFSPFYQDRNSPAGTTTLPLITTVLRPRTGTWFQGRVWYAGVDAYQNSVSADIPVYTWSESIYFSQVVQTQVEFGKCYQTNSPTAETLFALLPTDGGVIKIQGSGAIYKLFPIQNGLLVFAANGIWFITGSQGIGFTANDYTITKISDIRSLSSDSFVNVQGLPIFWNEEGIYTVSPAQQGLGLTVESLTYNSIDSFYSEIPVDSKKFARGDYNPIDYLVHWIYRSENPASIAERYRFDKVLCFNTKTKAFYTYTIEQGVAGTGPFIHGINYIPDYGATSPDAAFKYLTSAISGESSYFIFSEPWDDTYEDWVSWTGGINYTSYFVTGYKIRGQAQRRWQPGYVYMFSDVTDPVSYRIQGQYDYAITGNSGRWSANQLITIDEPDYNMAFRRHRLRGQGLVMQIKVTSVEGEPFNFIGWSIWETSNTGV